jgi:hypothetical protein
MLAELLNNARYWRERAEEAHVHANQLTDPEAKHIMLGIIGEYLKLSRKAGTRRLSDGPIEQIVTAAE